MSIIEMILLAVTFFLALGASWMLLLPFFNASEDEADLQPEQSADLENALRRKEMLLESLEDLEAERRSGKISEQDYKKTKAELNQDTAECLALLDSLQVNATRRSA